MHQFDISVITPVYNGERYLTETIESAVESLKDISHEIIVINDGSTDNTSTILAQFGTKIKVVSQENMGQPQAINNGLRIAKGKYSIIVNSDDPLTGPELFNTSIELLNSDRQLVGTYPDWSIIDEHGNITKKIKVKNYSREEMFCNFNCLIGPGGVFRTTAALEVGGWDPSYRFVPDFNFWLKLSEKGDFRRIPKNLAVWRSHSNSISIRNRGKGMADERIRVINETLQYTTFSLANKRRALANSYYHAAVLSYFDREVPGRKWLIKSIKLRPLILLSKKPWAILFLLLTPISHDVTSKVNNLILRFHKKI